MSGYFNNTDNPYPLAELDPSVPSDLLVDMALSVDAAIQADCRVTSVRVTEYFAFVAIETSSAAVAHVYVQNPQPWTIYQFEAQEGEGWIIFGPGVQREYELAADKELEIDPRALIANEPASGGFTLEVNGRQYEMPASLQVVGDGFIATEADPGRDLATGIAAALVLFRNDSLIDDTTLTRSLVENPLPPIYVFGDALPDANGNIDVNVLLEAGLTGSAGIIAVPCDNPDVQGFILWSKGIAGCEIDNLLEQLKFSDCGQGKPYPLPFDKILERFKGKETPCGPKAPPCA